MQNKETLKRAQERQSETRFENEIIQFIKSISEKPTDRDFMFINGFIKAMNLATGKEYYCDGKNLYVKNERDNNVFINITREESEPRFVEEKVMREKSRTEAKVSLNIRDDEEQGCQILNTRKEFLLDKMVEYLCNYGDVDLASLGADEYVPIEDAYNNCLGYIVELVGKNDSKPEFWEGVLGFTKEELLEEGMEWVYENESEIVEEKKQPLTVAELEQVMKDYNVVIRRIPDFRCETYEAKEIDKYPDGILTYIPFFDREMLLVDRKCQYGGKYLYTVCNSSGTMVLFGKYHGSIKSEQMFDSIEELVEDVKKRCKKVQTVKEKYPDEASDMKELVSNGNHIFEVVKVAPLGYEIWNIGKHAPEGYVPFCRLKAVQPFDGCREIETDTLRAVKSEHWDVIMDAVGYGPATLKEMEKYVKKHKDNPSKADIVAKMEKALPYMREIDWR